MENNSRRHTKKAHVSRPRSISIDKEIRGVCDSRPISTAAASIANKRTYQRTNERTNLRTYVRMVIRFDDPRLPRVAHKKVHAAVALTRSFARSHSRTWRGRRSREEVREKKGGGEKVGEKERDRKRNFETKAAGLRVGLRYFYVTTLLQRAEISGGCNFIKRQPPECQ